MAIEIYRCYSDSMSMDEEKPSPDKHYFSIVASDTKAEYVFPTGVSSSGLDDQRVDTLVRLYGKPKNIDEWLSLLSTNLGYVYIEPIYDTDLEYDNSPEDFADAIEDERGILDEIAKEKDRKEQNILISEAKFEEKYNKAVVAAAAAPSCPPATQDIAVNLKNRKNAIDTALYGPLNPSEPNDEYWSEIAGEWNVSPEEAKKQRCGNCAAFIQTPRMIDCIKSGLGNEEGNDAFDTINAGNLGYCEAFDFKCAAARTCRAWIAGGPVLVEKEENNG